MLRHRCLHCFASDGVEIGVTKRNAPYSTCRCCGTRTFMHTLDALRGSAVIPMMIDTALMLRESDSAYREKFDAAVASVQQEWLQKLSAASGRGPAEAPDQVKTPLSESRNVIPVDLERVGT